MNQRMHERAGRRWLAAALLLLASAAAASAQTVCLDLDAYARALENLPRAASSPDAAPGDWLLAHLDIETTGLVPGWHEPIDLGFVYTDLEGNVVDSLFLRVQPEHPERLSPGAARVNGFDAARWRELHALAPVAAVDSIMTFHRRVSRGRSALLVAFNSQFDTSFLDQLMRAQGHSWRELYHYFVLDIPSMAWARGYRSLTNGSLAEVLGVADEPRVAEQHTGITGALLNVRIYRALLTAPCR